MKYNPLEAALYFRSSGLPTPIFEFRHILGRRFRLDIAWPDYKIGIEVQGGIWIGGKHSRGAGQKKDFEKHNLGLVHGWRVLYVEPRDLMTHEVCDLVKKLMKDK